MQLEKYGMSEEDATDLADFIAPMLVVNPLERATAAEMLQHPWLHRSYTVRAAAQRCVSRAFA